MKRVTCLFIFVGVFSSNKETQATKDLLTPWMHRPYKYAPLYIANPFPECNCGVTCKKPLSAPKPYPNQNEKIEQRQPKTDNLNINYETSDPGAQNTDRNADQNKNAINSSDYSRYRLRFMNPGFKLTIPILSSSTSSPRLELLADNDPLFRQIRNRLNLAKMTTTLGPTLAWGSNSNPNPEGYEDIFRNPYYLRMGKPQKLTLPPVPKPDPNPEVFEDVFRRPYYLRSASTEEPQPTPSCALMTYNTFVSIVDFILSYQKRILVFGALGL